jgi:hypothetical protein
MTTITKDEVSKLTLEQQTAFAQLEFKRVLLKQKLLQNARGGTRSMDIVNGLFMGGAMALAMLSTFEPRLLQFAIFTTVALIGLRANELSRRIDAVLQLLESGQAKEDQVRQGEVSPELPELKG